MQRTLTRLALLGLLAAPAILAAPAALAAQGFEGSFTQTTLHLSPQQAAGLVGTLSDPLAVYRVLAPRLEDPAAPLTRRTQTIYVKGQLMRTDGGIAIFGPGVYGVLDLTLGSGWFVMPASRQVVLISGVQATLIAAQRYGVTSGDTARAHVTDLGARTIAGVSAHGYRLVRPASVEEVWFDPRQPALGRDPAGWARKLGMPVPAWAALPHAHGQPILAINVGRAPAVLGGGWQASRSMMGPLRRHALPDSLFRMPAGYRQVTMQQLLQGTTGVNPNAKPSNPTRRR